MRHDDVATVDVLERRLLAWGVWRSGGFAVGYPMTSVLHENWSPPAPGQLPTMQSARSTQQERQMDRLVAKLALKLRNTLVVVYQHRAPAAERGPRLGCDEGTVRVRLAKAKQLLGQMLTAEADAGASA